MLFLADDSSVRNIKSAIRAQNILIKKELTLWNTLAIIRNVWSKMGTTTKIIELLCATFLVDHESRQQKTRNRSVGEGRMRGCKFETKMFERKIT